MSFLKLDLVLVDRFLAMHAAMSPGLGGVCLPLSSLGSMAFERSGSKDTNRNETRAAAEWVSTSLLIYEDTKKIVDKDINQKWQEVNDAFSGTFGEDLEDREVYVNIHKSGLYMIACKSLVLPCMDMIHWIISHSDPETMTLSSVSRWRLLPLGHKFINRCIICQSPWSPLRLPLAYLAKMPTLEISWGTGWRSWVNLGWHPTRSTRWRYCRRCINTRSSLHVTCMANKARKPSHRVGWSCWTNLLEKENDATGLTCSLTS